MRALISTVIGATLVCGSAFAQSSGEIELEQLEMQTQTRGYAVVKDEKGFHHYCEAKNVADALEIGPCKPINMVTPVTREVAKPAAPQRDFTKAQIVSLFEQNGCSLKYADLTQAIQTLGARQQRVIAEKIKEMTASGEIADDAVRERATLKSGTRCR